LRAEQAEKEITANRMKQKKRDWKFGDEFWDFASTLRRRSSNASFFGLHIFLSLCCSVFSLKDGLALALSGRSVAGLGACD
jgi:hypothetical protein